MEQVDLDVFLAPSRCLATRSRTLIQLFSAEIKILIAALKVLVGL